MVNRLLAGLSRQQIQILETIARLDPDRHGKDGRYDPRDVSVPLVGGEGRSAAASLSRALVRLEGRGLIERHNRYEDGKKHGRYFFVFTAAGWEVLNAIRRRLRLPTRERIVHVPKPPMTDEEFTAWADAFQARYDLLAAQDMAAKLSRPGLEALRQWIDEQLRNTTR
jgi:DNA-binding MarR family transcriptional regulator